MAYIDAEDPSKSSWVRYVNNAPLGSFECNLITRVRARALPRLSCSQGARRCVRAMMCRSMPIADSSGLRHGAISSQARSCTTAVRAQPARLPCSFYRATHPRAFGILCVEQTRRHCGGFAELARLRLLHEGTDTDRVWPSRIFKICPLGAFAFTRHCGFSAVCSVRSTLPYVGTSTAVGSSMLD